MRLWARDSVLLIAVNHQRPLSPTAVVGGIRSERRRRAICRHQAAYSNGSVVSLPDISEIRFSLRLAKIRVAFLSSQAEMDRLKK